MTVTSPHDTDRQTLVLDTNVVLDWLVFDHPADRALGVAVRSGKVRWVATKAMRDELEHVLTRGSIADWQPDIAEVLRLWDVHSEVVEARPARPAPGLRCTDADDQKFIDLAFQCRPCALLSHDRAVLRCARAAAPWGVCISTAAAWLARTGQVTG